MRGERDMITITKETIEALIIVKETDTMETTMILTSLIEVNIQRSNISQRLKLNQ